MTGPETARTRQRVWRILKYLLPVLFLLIGFFGVQIWMMLDEQNAEDPAKPSSLDTDASRIKADLASITQPSEASAEETPVVLSKPTAVEQAVTAEIPGITYYRLQVGSFEDPQGVEKLRKKLKEMGYGSLGISGDKQSKVVAMAFFSRDQAAAVQSNMEAQGISGYPEKITVPSQMVLLQGSSQRLQSVMDASLTEVPEMLRELCDYYYMYESKGMDAEVHKALLLKHISRISDMKSSVENMQIAPEDQPLRTKLGDYLSRHLLYLEKAKNVKTLDRVSLWPGLMDGIEGFGKLRAKE